MILNLNIDGRKYKCNDYLSPIKRCILKYINDPAGSFIFSQLEEIIKILAIRHNPACERLHG